jgi:aryl-alcohol dehydrogenase-like predicted oxidoreductase
MDHARLGRTGLQVSRLCLGTMTFGLQSDESTAVAILDRAAEGGIDFLDTSDAYPLGGDLSTRGITEAILGRWLQGKRDRFIVATKCFAPTGPAPFDGGNSRKHILAAVDASLRRLQTDYIDLYQLHGYDQNTPIDETLSVLDDLVHAGKVRYIGCSNFLTYQLVRAIGRSETLRLARFDSVQPRYNLLFRQIEREMLPGGRRRRHPLQPDRRGPAVRQALADRPAPRGDPLHPRQCRAKLPGPLLARPRVRHG